MTTSVEISYYPLQYDYVEPIKDFIYRLNQYPEIQVQTSGMNTQIFGDYDQVMDILKNEIKKSFDVPHSVFVMKVANANLNHSDGSK